LRCHLAKRRIKCDLCPAVVYEQRRLQQCLLRMRLRRATRGVLLIAVGPASTELAELDPKGSFASSTTGGTLPETTGRPFSSRGHGELRVSWCR
ncbi:MAG TPA: hypothetical protein VKP30_29030, partial [Polyangiaceae bacterium]|nr:hypothetical protein [Polyangiaceae bacterium]